MWQFQVDRLLAMPACFQRGIQAWWLCQNHFTPFLEACWHWTFSFWMLSPTNFSPPNFAGERQAEGEVYRLPPHDLCQHTRLWQEEPYGKQNRNVIFELMIWCSKLMNYLIVVPAGSFRQIWPVMFNHKNNNAFYSSLISISSRLVGQVHVWGLILTYDTEIINGK